MEMDLEMDLESIQGTVNEVIPEALAGYIGFPAVLAAILVLGLVAVYSYKIFRLTLVVGGALFCGVLGSNVVAPILVGFLDHTPESFDIVYLVGFIFALLGGLLMKLFFKIALFIFGAGAGWVLGSTVIKGLLGAILSGVEFFNTEIGAMVVNAVCAIILGVLCLFLFKFVYILFTSLGGMVSAAVLIVVTVVPQPNTTFLLIAGVVGLIGGIVAAVNQFKKNAAPAVPHEFE